jgi:NADH:ubiquinone oxidoreductase subunit 3 (subunit A)
MGFGILFASHLFGQKATAGKIKDSPYECGLASDSKGETQIFGQILHHCHAIHLV